MLWKVLAASGSVWELDMKCWLEVEHDIKAQNEQIMLIDFIKINPLITALCIIFISLLQQMTSCTYISVKCVCVCVCAWCCLKLNQQSYTCRASTLLPLNYTPVLQLTCFCVWWSWRLNLELCVLLEKNPTNWATFSTLCKNFYFIFLCARDWI